MLLSRVRKASPVEARDTLALDGGCGVKVSAVGVSATAVGAALWPRSWWGGLWPGGGRFQARMAARWWR
jgi:hypothetical protein